MSTELLSKMEKVGSQSAYQWDALSSSASRESYPTVNPEAFLPSDHQPASKFTNEHTYPDVQIKYAQSEVMADVCGVSSKCEQVDQNGCQRRLPGVYTDDNMLTNGVDMAHHSEHVPANSIGYSSSVSRLVMCNTRNVKDRCQFDCLGISNFDESLINTVEVPGINSTPGMDCDEIAAKKRALHLSKNREAARVCRLKKKEYISCLETRVNVLEAQNRVLLGELRSLKELFHYQKDL